MNLSGRYPSTAGPAGGPGGLGDGRRPLSPQANAHPLPSLPLSSSRAQAARLRIRVGWAGPTAFLEPGCASPVAPLPARDCRSQGAAAVATQSVAAFSVVLAAKRVPS